MAGPDSHYMVSLDSILSRDCPEWWGSTLFLRAIACLTNAAGNVAHWLARTIKDAEGFERLTGRSR